MVIYLLLMALSGAYLSTYFTYCLKSRQIRAAVGALFLILPLILLLWAFVSVMLQTR